VLEPTVANGAEERVRVQFFLDPSVLLHQKVKLALRLLFVRPESVALSSDAGCVLAQAGSPVELRNATSHVAILTNESRRSGSHGWEFILFAILFIGKVSQSVTGSKVGSFSRVF
jgi:hypothetical protein